MGCDRPIYPSDYPLPIEPISGVAYWQLNIMLCREVPGWMSFQAEKPMTEVIPVIDRIVANSELSK